MGLFSKKDYVCVKCQKSFQARLKPVDNLCDDCLFAEEDEKKKLAETLKGYTWYHEKVRGEFYSLDDMRKIVNKRNSLIEKYTNNYRITEEELLEIGANYKTITEEQAQNVVSRLTHTMLTSTFGLVYSNKFLVSTEYDGMLVDVDDVFAVGYVVDPRLNGYGKGVCLCVILTNDPYVPVLSMLMIADNLNLAVNYVGTLFNRICKNLMYDVMDLKRLKSEIKEDGEVEGNLDIKFVIEQINNAINGVGIFNSTKTHCDLMPISAEIIKKMGYIPTTYVEALLRFDKRANRKYWLEQMEKYNNTI